MRPPIKKHSLLHNILGEIEFTKPVRFDVVYPDAEVFFYGIVKFTAMKTGCSVLTHKTGRVTVLVSGHRYYTYR